MSIIRANRVKLFPAFLDNDIPCMRTIILIGGSIHDSRNYQATARSTRLDTGGIFSVSTDFLLGVESLHTINVSDLSVKDVAMLTDLADRLRSV